MDLNKINPISECFVGSLIGLDGKPLETPEDFKRHEVYCTAKIAMHQAIVDGLTPSYERLCRELIKMKRR